MVRLTGTHNNIVGDTYKVEIIDKTGGASGLFQFNGDGYDITPIGEPKNLHKTFNPSECTFTMRIDPSNSAHNSFVDDLKNSPENRFFVKAYHNGFLDFAGPIKMDAVYYEDVPTIYDFTIVASDGISGTAGIDYSDDGDAYEGRQTYMEHIINIIQKIGVEDLYEGDDAITVVVNWYAEEMPNKGTDNPWDMADVEHELFIKRGEDGSPIFMKCMQVLEILLTPWHACLRYGQGRWWIEQIGERVNTTFVGWTYAVDGTLRQTQTWNLDSLVEQNKANWKNSKFSMRGRRYNFIPSLREVNVNYTFDEEIAAVSKDLTWNSASGDVCSPDALGVAQSNDVVIRVVGQLKLKSDIDLTELADNGWTAHRYYFKMRIRLITVVTDEPLLPKYFERVITYADFYNPIVADGDWGDYDEVKYIDILGPIMERKDNGRFIYIPIEFETKKSAAMAGFSLRYQTCFELDGVKTVGHNSIHTEKPGLYETSWSFENVEVFVVDPAALEGKAKSRTEIIKGKGNTDNTAVVDIDTILGDKRTAKNSIFVWDGTEFVPPTMWGVGSDMTHESILELLIDEILAIRTTPMEISNMELTGKGYTMLTTGRYAWQGKYYLFDIGTKNSQRASMRGDYFALAKVPSTSVKTKVLVVNKVDTYATRQSDNGVPGDIPPLDNEGITLIGDSIQAGDTITSINIPSAVYNYFRTGDIIEVRDPATGLKQKFTVSADVNQGDTAISVNSVAATANLSLQSKVIFDWAYESGQTYNETKERYEFFSVDEGNVSLNDTELVITAFALPPTGTSIEQSRKRVRVQRNGTWLRLVADVSAYTGQQPLRVFEIDADNSKILLHATAPIDAWDEFDIYAFEIVK